MIRLFLLGLTMLFSGFSAVAADAPVKMTDYMNDEYREKYTPVYQISDDGKRVLVSSFTKGSNDFVQKSTLWDYDSSLGTYVLHSFDGMKTDTSKKLFGFFGEKPEDKYFLDYDDFESCKDRTELRCPRRIQMSADGSTLFAEVYKHKPEPNSLTPEKLYAVYPDKKEFKEIPIEPIGYEPVIDYSGKHTAALAEYNGKYRIEIYSLADDKKYELFSFPKKGEMVAPMKFDRAGKLFQFRNNDAYTVFDFASGGQFKNFFSRVHFGYGVINDGQKMVIQGDDFSLRLCDINSGTKTFWKDCRTLLTDSDIALYLSPFSQYAVNTSHHIEYLIDLDKEKAVPFPTVFTDSFNGAKVYFSPNGRLINVWNNAADEYLIKDGKAIYLQTFWYKQTTEPKAVYVRDADAWFLFRNGELIKMPSAGEKNVKAAEYLDKGIGLMEAEFYSAAFAEYTKGLNEYPEMFMPVYDIFVKNISEKMPLRYIGEFLLKEHEVFTNTSKQYIALLYYGMFAVKAGHTDSAMQAVRLMRDFAVEKKLNLSVANEMADGLEALVIAVNESPDKAYDFLVSRSGLKQSFSYFKYFPELSAPLMVNTKKMAYITGVSEDELPTPSPGAYQQTNEPYPDITGAVKGAAVKQTDTDRSGSVKKNVLD
ncbi:MAG: hypothetical protein AB7E96_02510 [Deferribacterales bacterium]